MAKIVSTGKTLSSPEYYRKKQREKRRKIIIFSTVILLILVIVVIVARLERLQISSIEVRGADVIPADDVKKVVGEILDDSYLWLIPKSNFLIYPRSSIERSLLDTYPRFSAVATSLVGSKTVEISVVEREPYALYCADVSNLNEVSSCYFLDERGFIFDDAPAFSGAVYFIYTLSEPLEDPKGSEYMEVGEFKEVTKFVEELEKLGLRGLALEATENDLRVVMSPGSQLLWKRGDDLDLIYSNLAAFMNSKEIKSQPDFLDRVLVLDLRIENQVRYRFKE